MTVSLTAPEGEQARELALANRILALKQIVDGFGHVSARSATRPDHFLLARNMAPAQVTAEDVHLYSLDGECVSQPGVRSYLERFIHGEIYRARPDVHAVVHAHALSVLPFAVVPGASLQAIFHMAGFLGDGLPLFEIRCCDPASDLLIRNRPLGVALADALGKAPGILMRGHGFTMVGATVRQAVYRAVYADANARIQLQAVGLGAPIYLNAAEARAADATNGSEVDRAWNLWVGEVEASRSAAA